MATLLRDAGLSDLIDAAAEVEMVATGFQFTEGPLWLPDGALLFQDIEAERTYRLEPDDTVSLLREQTGAANGQTFDADERVVFCEQNGRRVSRMYPDGTGVETLAEEYEGKRLNSPNDIIARSDGMLFFTDPAYGAPPDRPLDFQGVYALDRAGNLRLLADDFEKPNGLALSPDEKTLYVCDTGKYHVRAFTLTTDGGVLPESGGVLATMDPESPGGPDGLKLDREGRLYVAVSGGIWVFDPEGTPLGIIALTKRPSNLAWVGPEFHSLAITAGDTLYRIELLNVTGKAPAFLPRRTRTETMDSAGGSPS